MPGFYSGLSVDVRAKLRRRHRRSPELRSSLREEARGKKAMPMVDMMDAWRQRRCLAITVPLPSRLDAVRIRTGRRLAVQPDRQAMEDATAARACKFDVAPEPRVTRCPLERERTRRRRTVTKFAAVEGVGDRRRLDWGGKTDLGQGSTSIPTCPVPPMLSARAAALDKSMIRPRTYGPRSLMRHTMLRPRKLTRRSVPKR